MKDNEGLIRAEMKSRETFLKINLTRFTDQMGVDDAGRFKNEF